jgi:hypothetical protein
VLVLLAIVSACGKKGPPLPPLQLVPTRIEDLTVTRRADEMQVRLTVPTTNEDPKKRTPADVSGIEIYALTGKPEDPFGNPLTQRDFLKYSTRIGDVAIKPPPKPDEGDDSDDKAKDKDKKSRATATAAEKAQAEKDKQDRENRAAAAQAALKASQPPDPRPGQGEQLTLRETMTPALMTPWVHPKKKQTPDKAKAEELPGRPLWWPPPEELLTRVYIAVGVNHSGKRGNPSNKVFLPLSDAPKAPAAIDVKYDASALTISWVAPSDARLAIQKLPEVGMLSAKPIVEGSGVTTYNVYDAKALDAAAKATDTANSLAAAAAAAATAAATKGGAAKTGKAAAAGLLSATAVAAPKVAPLNPAPIDTSTFIDTRLAYGEERCYTVRAVLVYGGARLESPTAPTTCVTPKDTFPPSAPKNLAAVGSEGGVSLIWEADSEADLDGYLVLRGELKADGTAPDKLAPITPEPIHETTYRDNKARPGVRYVYAVVAVDKATPRNVSEESNRVEESAR